MNNQAGNGDKERYYIHIGMWSNGEYKDITTDKALLDDDHYIIWEYASSFNMVAGEEQRNT